MTLHNTDCSFRDAFIGYHLGLPTVRRLCRDSRDDHEPGAGSVVGYCRRLVVFPRSYKRQLCIV